MHGIEAHFIDIPHQNKSSETFVEIYFSY